MSSESPVAEGAQAHGAAAQSTEQAMELPSFLDFSGLDLHHHYFGFSLHEWVPVIMSLLVGTLLVGFSLWATRRMEKIPRGSQAFLEIVVAGLSDFLAETLGKHTPRYLPLLGTLFLYILLMNLWGLIPLMHSPTAKINTTLPLALTVFVFYNIEGVRMKGIKYFKHFFEPLFMAPIMFPLHVIGECVRPLSLAVRLFGNLTGEDLTLALLVMLTPFVFGVPIPLHLVMVLMALLFSVIQATIFTLLSAVYLSLAVGDDH